VPLACLRRTEALGFGLAASVSPERLEEDATACPASRRGRVAHLPASNRFWPTTGLAGAAAAARDAPGVWRSIRPWSFLGPEWQSWLGWPELAAEGRSQPPPGAWTRPLSPHPQRSAMRRP